jgi:hypothetical protein
LCSKTAYITLKDGTTVEGDIKKIKRKKDHFGEVVLPKYQLSREAHPSDGQYPEVFEIHSHEPASFKTYLVNLATVAVPAHALSPNIRIHKQIERNGKDQERNGVENAFTPSFYISFHRCLWAQQQVFDIIQKPFVHIGQGRKAIPEHRTESDCRHTGLFAALGAKRAAVLRIAIDAGHAVSYFSWPIAGIGCMPLLGVPYATTLVPQTNEVSKVRKTSCTVLS